MPHDPKYRVLVLALLAAVYLAVLFYLIHSTSGMAMCSPSYPC